MQHRRRGERSAENFILVFVSLYSVLCAGVIKQTQKTSRSRVRARFSLPQVVVDRLVSLAQSVLDEQGITWEGTLYVGIACPGQIDRYARSRTNMHTWWLSDKNRLHA